MVWKLFLYATSALFLVKLVFRTRLREWGRKLDHAVNVTILAIVVAYVGYFLWHFLAPNAPS